MLSSVFSLPSKTRRRTLGSPRRTRTQSTSLEAKPRRRYAVVNIHPELALHCVMWRLDNLFDLAHCRAFLIVNTTFVILSRSGPREK